MEDPIILQSSNVISTVETTTVHSRVIKKVDNMPLDMLVSQARKLVEMGFQNKKRNMKMLIRTRGNFEAVSSFLQAKQHLMVAVKDVKRTKYFEKEMKKKAKKDKKDKKKKEDKGKKEKEAQVEKGEEESAMQVEENGAQPSSLLESETLKTEADSVPSIEQESQVRGMEEVTTLLSEKELKKKEKKEKKDLKEREKREKKDKKKEDKKKEKHEKKDKEKKEKEAKEEKEKKEKKDKKDKKDKKEKKDKKDKKDKKSKKDKMEIESKQADDAEAAQQKEVTELNEEVANLLALSSSESWPNSVSHLFINGDNLLYVCAPIRALVLQGKFTAAEELLQDFSREIASTLKVPNCTLVFDKLHTKPASEDNFELCSAEPKYASSNDMLAEVAQQHQDSGSSSLQVFVTSDMTLTDKLAKIDSARICKPKEWFQFGSTVLRESNTEIQDKTFDNFDSFVTYWMEQREADDKKETESNVETD